MKVKVKVSRKALAEYAAIMWNSHGETYVPWGSTFVDVLENTVNDPHNEWPGYIGKAYLLEEFEYWAEGWLSLLEEEERCRGAKMPDERKQIGAFRRQIRAWEKRTEEGKAWTYDTDDDSLVKFPDGKKAVVA